MKKIVLLVGVSAALWNVLSYAGESGDWIVDAKGCKVWNAHPLGDESVAWSGSCKDGYADGPGVLQWLGFPRSQGCANSPRAGRR